MCAKRLFLGPLNVVEFLLQGWPGECLPVAVGDMAQSPRDDMIETARRWVGNPSLTDAERGRIQRVWLDGVYERGILNELSGDRRAAIRALIVPESVVGR